MKNLKPLTTISYRRDIDGLRAVAVLAVLFYHFGISPFHGGFAGVDVFFVISGYLITSIIHKEMGRGEFSFARFYERRIRRIFPALFAVLLATLAAGTLLLLPSDLVRLGDSTLATLLFSSNVLFWRHSGYFDPSSAYNPLLHTWSLAVEEQFYIGLPILLLLLHRYAKGWLKAALLICAILSLLICIWIQVHRPAATFFLSPFRAWELLLGSLLAVGAIPAVHSRKLRELLSLGSFGILLASLCWLKAGTDFPGWRASIPVVTTAALLHAGAHGDSLVKRLLSVRPLVSIGLISYSLYLWHWPLLVFVRYRSGMQPISPATGLILLGVSILLAAACYRWVETPFRRRGSKGPNSWRYAVHVNAGIACALVAGVAVASQLQQGWRGRFSPEVVGYDLARSPVIPYLSCSGLPPTLSGVDGCVVGDKSSRKRIVLWGDSYALAWAPAFDELGLRYGFAVELAWLSQCPGLLGLSVSASAPCKEFNRSVANRIAEGGLDGVVLVGSWVPYIDPGSGIVLRVDYGRGRVEQSNAQAFSIGLQRTVELMKEHELRTILIGPTPGAPGDIPYRMAAAVQFGLQKPIAKSVAESVVYNEVYFREVARYRDDPFVQLVNPLPWFKLDGEYRYVDDGGRLLYRDGGHLSLAGAEFVSKRFPDNILWPREGSPFGRLPRGVGIDQ